MATHREMVEQGIAALGDQATYNAMKVWLKKKFGIEVSDSVFYTVRKDVRDRAGRILANSERRAAADVSENNGVTPAAAPENPPVSTAVSERIGATQRQQDQDFTFVELKEVAAFSKRIGGRGRLQRMLAALEDLQ